VRVASFFAGIGGFDIGFQHARHEIVFQCEIDNFCNEILAYHWPNVPRIKDIKEIRNGAAVPESEIWCGGFPCQDVSLARARPRAGLAGEQTGLFYTFAELIGQARPPVVVLENVPGLLSSHGGRDFGIILQKLASFGYAVAWRVLDSQHFGVPQSRDRLYIVGYHRDPRRAGAVLFEPECSEGDAKAGRKSKKKSLSPFKESLGDPRKGPIVQRIAYCLAATSGRHTGTDWSRTYVSYPDAVRRLMPEEAERLQGFPRGWTHPPELNGMSPDRYDSLRYASLGNAVSVPAAEWIGNRIRLAAEMPDNETMAVSTPVEACAVS
jgi:DNA (cytosine-5)-methyltransferase 1